MTDMPPLALDPYVVNTLMRDLVRHDRAPSAFLVYLWLWSKTRGAGRTSFGASLQTIATETGLSKSTVQTALRRLRRRRLIAVRHGGPTTAGLFEVLEPWKRGR
jgi:DNA-binding MarR family transcriptional regulator